MKSLIQWLPRIICSLYVLAMSWFLFTCFEVPNTLIGILTFMRPVIIMLSIIIISWWLPAYGMLLCPAIGIGFIVLTNGEGNLLYYGLVVFPIFFAGILYLIDHTLYRKI